MNIDSQLRLAKLGVSGAGMPLFCTLPNSAALTEIKPGSYAPD
jgi:hypothetical protein